MGAGSGVGCLAVEGFVWGFLRGAGWGVSFAEGGES